METAKHQDFMVVFLVCHPDRWRQQSIILRRQQSIIHIFIDPTIDQLIARSINQSEVDCRPVHKGSTKENDSQSITQSVDRSMNRANSKNPPINRSDYSWYTHHNNDFPHKGSIKENDLPMGESPAPSLQGEQPSSVPSFPVAGPLTFHTLEA